MPLLTQCHQELSSTTNILTLTSDVETRLLVNCWNTPLAPQGTWQPTAFRWSFLQQPTTTDNLTENRSFLQLTIFSTTNNSTENNKSRESLWVSEYIIGTFKLSNEVCLFTQFGNFLFWQKLMTDSDATDESAIAEKALVVLFINVKIWGLYISQHHQHRRWCNFFKPVRV